MAAGCFPEPGDKDAQGRPLLCEGECDHVDCAEIRMWRDSKCTLCNERIGSRRFCRTNEYANEYNIVHAACLEDKVL